MTFQTKPGPWGKTVLIFSLGDLPMMQFDGRSGGMGLIFIDAQGEIHFEINNLHIFAGNPLEMIFAPNRFYRKLGRHIARMSLAKAASELLGGLLFFYNSERHEIRWSGTGLLPWDETHPSLQPIRKVAFERLMNGLDAIAIKLGASYGIGATDQIAAQKLAPLGWTPHSPPSWRENLRIHLYELPFWPRQLYIKKWG